MRQPKPGEKYYHYKSAWCNDHLYEIVWIAKHSETDELMVIYKPLYDASSTWLGACKLAVRPLSMWFEDVEWDGKKVQRFVKSE